MAYNGWELIDGQRGWTTFRDVLHNLSARENGDNHEYSKGVLVGVVSTLVACGMDMEEAFKMTWQGLPQDTHYERIPESFRDRLGLAKVARHTRP